MANNTKTSKKDIMGMMRLAFILFAIAAVVALLLSAVNEITKGPIKQQKEAAVYQAMSQVVPAESYEKIDISNIEGLDKTVLEFYAARNGADDIGYCVKTAPLGFGGPIEVITGIDLEGKVTHVHIVSMAETAGLGTKAKEPDFLAQYSGKGIDVAVTTGSNPKENEISAISGATVSSKAVTAGVAAAISTVNLVVNTTKEVA